MQYHTKSSLTSTNITILSQYGHTPLHICCKERQTELVLKLIEYGAVLTAYNCVSLTLQVIIHFCSVAQSMIGVYMCSLQNDDTCLHLSEVLMNNRMLAVLLDAFACSGINVDQRNGVCAYIY